MTDRVDINRLLTEMRSIKAQTHAFGGSPQVGGIGRESLGGVNGSTPETQRVNFGDVMGNALNKVNSIQQDSAALSKSYLRGEEGVDISQVMIASQKSSIAFQAATQVRNKVVEAYKDVMNMPI